MSTQFNTDFSNGDLIAPDHISQFAQPINDLESGAAQYREATNDSGVYKVDFRPSANPDGHFLGDLNSGQPIVFKAGHNSPADAQLKVLLDDSDESHPLFINGVAVEAGEILTGQIVTAIFNETTPPRFDVIGAAKKLELQELTDVTLSNPTNGQVLRYDSTGFVNANVEMDDVDGLLAAIASAGGTASGHLAELQSLSLVEGDLLTVDSDGEVAKLPVGTEGQVLKIDGGLPAWGAPVGGGGVGGDFLVNGLVAHGSRYGEITSTSQNLKSSPFFPIIGRQYLIRWIANHTDSVFQLDRASAIANSQPHFCRAVETESTTAHEIGFSGPTAADYTCDQTQRTRTHEFVWTANTDEEVEIVLGQPSLTYGEFTGTLLVYEVKQSAINLGWGTYSISYSWLADSTNSANSLNAGAYRSGVSLDATKTYAFIGNWTQGCSLKLVLRQGSNYWRLPPKSDTWAVASPTENAWEDGMYYQYSYIAYRGEFVRFFSPPSTGTYDLGCGLWSIVSGCFWLVELP